MKNNTELAADIDRILADCEYTSGYEDDSHTMPINSVSASEAVPKLVAYILSLSREIEAKAAAQVSLELLDESQEIDKEKHDHPRHQGKWVTQKQWNQLESQIAKMRVALEFAIRCAEGDERDYGGELVPMMKQALE